MQSLLAIARLTFKAAFRFRLVPLLGVALIGSVFLLPAVIKDDGTARGLTQIVLTYTLGLTTAVLGLTTLWLACGTLARDIEDFTIQTVAVKPVARWKIWLGKWLGIMLINALLLGLSATVTYLQLVWRAQRLPAEQQQVLRNEVFVARGSFREPFPNLEPEVERRLQERLRNEQVAAMDRTEARRIIREQIKAELQVVPPGHLRAWSLDLRRVAHQVRDQPLFARVKFFANEKSPTGNYAAVWDVGPLDSPNRQRTERLMAAETFYEIELPPTCSTTKAACMSSSSTSTTPPSSSRSRTASRSSIAKAASRSITCGASPSSSAGWPPWPPSASPPPVTSPSPSPPSSPCPS
ncbi:MAG: ABC transporter permease [Verrucomicrobia bacterium]|nr:ABC transporter permease [Verrucomicrobiota bacterium]